MNIDWTNEVISNYVIFAAGLIIGLLTHLFRTFKRRPIIIELEKESEVNLLKSLEKKARERLMVTYNEESVSKFYETVFQLRNRSRQTLKNIELKLHLTLESEPQKLFEIVLNDPIEDLRTPSATAECIVSDTNHYLHIKTPYVNSVKDHQDKIELRMYTPEPMEVLRLVGGGADGKVNM